MPSMDDWPMLVSGGACTSVGSTLAASAAAVRAGIAGFTDHAFVIDAAGQPMTVSRAPFLGLELQGTDRLLELATPAAEEAMAGWCAATGPAVPVCAVVALPLPRAGLEAGFEVAFRDRLHQRLHRSVGVESVEIVQAGHSGGLIALHHACRQILRGSALAVLVGGVDSYLDPTTLEWLESCGQVHGAGLDNNAWGFVPGEAAGFVLVSAERSAQRRRLQPLARVRSIAVQRESALIKTDSVCVGRGLTLAFQQVFGALAAPTDRIDAVYCDMNGEPYRAEEFGFATIRTEERFIDSSQFQAPADCWGDVGAASGPLLVSLAAIAHGKGYLPAQHALVWTSAEGGERAAAIIDCVDPARSAT